MMNNVPWLRLNNLAMRARCSEKPEVESEDDVEDIVLACFAIVFCALWNNREVVSILGTRTYGKHTVALVGTAGVSVKEH